MKNMTECEAFRANVPWADTSRVTRVEVIDPSGRAYVAWDNQITVRLSFQDDGRTLKVFVEKKPPSGSGVR